MDIYQLIRSGIVDEAMVGEIVSKAIRNSLNPPVPNDRVINLLERVVAALDRIEGKRSTSVITPEEGKEDRKYTISILPPREEILEPVVTKVQKEQQVNKRSNRRGSVPQGLERREMVAQMIHRVLKRHNQKLVNVINNIPLFEPYVEPGGWCIRKVKKNTIWSCLLGKHGFPAAKLLYGFFKILSPTSEEVEQLYTILPEYTVNYLENNNMSLVNLIQNPEPVQEETQDALPSPVENPVIQAPSAIVKQDNVNGMVVGKRIAILGSMNTSWKKMISNGWKNHELVNLDPNKVRQLGGKFDYQVILNRCSHDASEKLLKESGYIPRCFVPDGYGKTMEVKTPRSLKVFLTLLDRGVEMQKA
jgi:hypothetical protein